MDRPELIFVTGCNAAGKTTLIRSHLSQFPGYEVIMTDVYKGRAREVFKDRIQSGKSIILETPFNDDGFTHLIDLARTTGYQSSLISLFLKSPAQSIDRVASRRALENGLHISAGNVEYNFIENFKNVATYFIYFDESSFVYTGETGQYRLIMKFEKDTLIRYKANDLTYPQKFAEYAYQHQRLDKHEYDLIAANKDYRKQSHTLRRKGPSS